jgi:hypothetical protein
MAARAVTCRAAAYDADRARQLTALFAATHRPDACAHAPIRSFFSLFRMSLRI